jgi:2-dehydro-3-deoxyphosphooctonate aldolase (KDO 8-P synthase)
VLDSKNIWKNLNSPRQLFLLAGPCVIENEKLCRTVAASLKKICGELKIYYVFKASFDKANRTSGKAFRGPGLADGLKVLANIRDEFQVPVVTDIHTEEQARLAGEVVDILQIPAFLCRQTDLIEAAVATGKIVNIKKGQFLSPQEMGRVAEKAEKFWNEKFPASSSGHSKLNTKNSKLLLTERGTTFGYNNLVADMRSIPVMKSFGFPVVFDATHSVQQPGGGGDKTTGQREFAPVLAKAALAVGANGLFIETHPQPDAAMSDGPNMIPLGDMKKVLGGLKKIYEAAN